MTTQDIAANLRAARARSSLTHSEIAGRCHKVAVRHDLNTAGFSKSSIHHYEHGTRVPSVDVIRVLALVYGVAVRDLAPDLEGETT